MSNVIEAIVCHAPDADAIISLTSIPLLVKVIEGDVFVARPALDRRTFKPEFDAFAATCSEVFGKVLLIRDDDRVGYRESQLFENGAAIASFGPNDEVWVLVDEDYNPLPEKGTFKANETDDDDPDAEYVTLHNAIELGMAAFGVSITWADFKSVILSLD